MRTTLTLDDDIVAALKDQARRLDCTFRQVVNQTLRRGLSESPDQEAKPPDDGGERPIFRVKPICSGFAPGVDPLKLNQLNSELEDAEFLKKLRT